MRQVVVVTALGVLVACLCVALNVKVFAVLGVPVVALMLLNPVFALMVTVASTVTGFMMVFSGPSAIVTISLPKLSGVVTLFSLLVHNLRRRKGFYLGSRIILPVVFILASALSLAFSPASETSIKTLTQLCGSFFFYFLALNIVKRENAFKTLLIVLAAAYGFASVYSLFQYIMPSTWTDEFSQQSGGLYQAFVDRGIKRSAGFSHPGVFSFVVVMLLPYIVYLFFEAKKKAHKIGAFLGLAVCVNAVLLTHTRVAFLSLGFMFVLFWWKKVIRIQIPVFVGLGLLGIVYLYFVMPATFSERVLSVTGYLGEGSVKMRLENQANGLALFAENPVLGVGVGNFEARNDVAREVNKEATNMYLEIASETGVVGLLAALAFIGVILKDAIAAERFYPGKGGKNLGTIMLISILVAMFESLFMSSQDFRVWWLFMSFPPIIRNIRMSEAENGQTQVSGG